ncbi:MAG: hypothetical protein EXR75_05305 [Myxococcales bacterium]|nr:hypothetical protein [Myxococcales bacterium]
MNPSLALRALVSVALAVFAAAAPARAEAPALAGQTLDYRYDAKDIGHPERAWLGRAFVPNLAATASGGMPLIVFMHGLNKALIKHRWMGGGSEGDVRRIALDLVTNGKIEPVIVAGPSSIIASEVSQGASFNHFDLDRFLDHTIEALRGVATIDEARIVVAGHSGAGCSLDGGIASVKKSRRRIHAVLAIDTCMLPGLAELLSNLGPRTHVVATYQTASWKGRPFQAFSAAFARGVARRPVDEGITRVLERQSPAVAPHDSTVPLTFERWLPALLPPRARVTLPHVE